MDKHTHGYIGAGDNYAQSFINRPLSQQPSGYHTSPSHRDSSSKPSHFDYYTSLTSYRTTNFVKIEFIRFKIGNVTDCSTATVTEGLLLADIFNSTFYFIAEKINIQVLKIKEDTNIFINCPIFEVYHQHGTSMMIHLRYALVGEGYTLKYMSGKYSHYIVLPKSFTGNKIQTDLSGGKEFTRTPCLYCAGDSPYYATYPDKTT